LRVFTKKHVKNDVFLSGLMVVGKELLVSRRAA
jgi:hypothetical protein